MTKKVTPGADGAPVASQGGPTTGAMDEYTFIDPGRHVDQGRYGAFIGASRVEAERFPGEVVWELALARLAVPNPNGTAPKLKKALAWAVEQLRDVEGSAGLVSVGAKAERHTNTPRVTYAAVEFDVATKSCRRVEMDVRHNRDDFVHSNPELEDRVRWKNER